MTVVMMMMMVMMTQRNKETEFPLTEIIILFTEKIAFKPGIKGLVEFLQ